ncbi:hypothetical protein [Motilimonas eburnea]|uniref:hypothetical protein n=1 Tax=Motilimonas eburnea TaxID=1737488 RepID=UPI001E581ADC|nr:hypothetical protein [Motilimonas eburnea]MCE2573421.1 hypothetical protein [Motilimonas eburnea]
MQTIEVTPKEFFTELEYALSSRSFDGVEALRDYVSPQFAEHLTNQYLEAEDWGTKELIIHLVQDQLSNDFSTILLDAIKAPSAESKAYSICFREQDRALFNKYVVDYFVSAQLVEKDAKKYLPSKPWWKFW